eukprot:5117682-Amphidinium_carterae.3
MPSFVCKALGLLGVVPIILGPSVLGAYSIRAKALAQSHFKHKGARVAWTLEFLTDYTPAVASSHHVLPCDANMFSFPKHASGIESFARVLSVQLSSSAVVVVQAHLAG